MKTELRHTLVQYHGGGYDGCFWEWNFFYIDATGEFYDIQSSGYNGCGNAENADALLAENDSHTYTYDVMDVEQILGFCNSSNAIHVLGVLRWFNEYNNPDIEFFALCTECGEHITWGSDGEAMLENWHGCGGIASTADELLCSDCYSAGTCDCCNEYVGQSELEYVRYLDDCSEEIQAELECWDDDNGPACQYCWENERDSLIDEEQQDLLTASLATGAPDLFSDDMRWFWNAE